MFCRMRTSVRLVTSMHDTETFFNTSRKNRAVATKSFCFATQLTGFDIILNYLRIRHILPIRIRRLTDSYFWVRPILQQMAIVDKHFQQDFYRRLLRNSLSNFA
jgi:hypothetical protein